MSLTSGLLIAATVLGGLLAGGNVDRAFVAMPAWQKVGPVAWAEFSRSADLGNGIFLYPLEAIGSAALTLAAAIAFSIAGGGSAWAGALIWLAVVACVAGLGLTIKAAPIMLGIRNARDPDELGRSFDGFRSWGNLRGIAQGLAFLLQVLALAMLSGNGG